MGGEKVKSKRVVLVEHVVFELTMFLFASRSRVCTKPTASLRTRKCRFCELRKERCLVVTNERTERNFRISERNLIGAGVIALRVTLGKRISQRSGYPSKK